MKVELNIENDSELRAHIKDVIRGQILSIVREEVMEIVKDELARKIKSTKEKAFDQLFETSMESAINKILRSEHNVTEWYDSFIAPIVTKRIDEIAEKKNWDTLIDGAARRKLTKMIE